MRYDAEHKARTRNGILVETANAIRAKGPERIGVAEVMSRLGLTHGGFYAHFKSKDELVAETIRHMFDQSYAWFLSKTGGVGAKEGLRAYVHAYLSRAHRDTQERGCTIAVLAGESTRLPDAARLQFSEGCQRLPAAMAALLESMGNPDAKRLAFSAVAEMVGSLVLARTLGPGDTSDALLLHARQTVTSRLGIS